MLRTQVRKRVGQLFIGGHTAVNTLNPPLKARKHRPEPREHIHKYHQPVGLHAQPQRAHQIHARNQQRRGHGIHHARHRAQPHIPHPRRLERRADLFKPRLVLALHAVGANLLDARKLVLQLRVKLAPDADHLVPVIAGLLPQRAENGQHARAQRAHQRRHRHAHQKRDGQLHPGGHETGQQVNHLADAVAHLPALGREQVDRVRVLARGQALPARAGNRLIQPFAQPPPRFLNEIALANRKRPRKQRLHRHQQHIRRQQNAHAQRIGKRGKRLRQPRIANLQHIQKRNEHHNADSAEERGQNVPTQNRQKRFPVTRPDFAKQWLHRAFSPPKAPSCQTAPAARPSPPPPSLRPRQIHSQSPSAGRPGSQRFPAA